MMTLRIMNTDEEIKVIKEILLNCLQSDEEIKELIKNICSGRSEFGINVTDSKEENSEKDVEGKGCLEHENGDLEQDNKDLKREKGELEQKKIELEQDNKDLKREKGELEQENRDLKREKGELEQKKIELEQDNKDLKREKGELEHDNIDLKVVNEKKFPNGWGLYQELDKSSDETKECLSKCMKCASFSSFICSGAQLQNLEFIWDEALKAKRNNEQYADLFWRIFVYCTKLVNLAREQELIVILEPKLGDRFYSEIHSTTGTNSTAQGEVRDIILPGYRNTFKKEIKRKSNVVIG